MKKKIVKIALPFVARRAARRRRRSKAEHGFKFAGPAALGIGATAAAFLLRRRRKRSAAGYDVRPEELQRTDPPRADAVRSDADVATGAGNESNGAASVDALGASATDAGTAPPESDSVTPDTGADDPLVREQTNAAAAEAGAIGGEETTPGPDAVR
jgi:hypothetical protein